MADPKKVKEMASRMGGVIPKGAGIGVGFLAAAGLAGYGLTKSLFTVEGGHRAILFSRISGVGSEVFKEGLHFRLPWFQWPIIYDVRTRPHKIVSLTGSKDLQMVNISMRVLSRPDLNSLPRIYRQLGSNWDERVLPSITNEVLKSVVAKFNASQLITQRQQVSMLIRNQLTERAKDWSIILDDVALTELTFGKEYTAAVEAKQIAQQDSQRAAFLVDKAVQEKQQKIVQAEGEAQAAKMVGQAVIKDPGFMKLRKIRAGQLIAKTVSQSNNRVYLNSGSLMVNLADKDYYEDAENIVRKRKT